MAGMLYLVPTPIGNLSDISIRCRETLEQADFIAARNAVYGQMISGLDNPESCGDLLIGAHMDGVGVFDMLEAAASVTVDMVEQRLQTDFEESASSLSIVSPLE